MLIRDAHPGYISWERYESIQEQLSASAKALLAWQVFSATLAG